MIDLHIDGKKKIAKVIKDGKILNAQELTQQEFKELMGEMCGERLDFVREATKLFKVKSFTFKDVQ